MNPSVTGGSSGFTFGLTSSNNAFSFGSSPFGAAKPSLGLPSATNTTSSTQAATPSIFGSPGSFAFGLQSPKPTLATATTSGLTFGTPSASTGSATTGNISTQSVTSTIATGVPALGSAFSFGQLTPTATTTSTPSLFKQPTSITSSTTASPFTLPSSNTATSTNTTSSLLNFGFPQSSVTTTNASAIPAPTTVVAATSTTAGALPLLGGISNTAPFSSNLKPGALTTSTSLGLGVSSSALTSSLTPTISTTGSATLMSAAPTTSSGLGAPSAPPATTSASSSTSVPQTLTYNQLEELINKWTHELDEHERYFLAEANRINQWDNTLISNAENITAIYEKVEHCQEEQTRLGQELDFIEGQQRELESLLEPLERAVNELPVGQLHSDYEREAIFQLSTNVDLELGQLLNDLREIASQTNATNTTLSGPRGDLTAAGDSGTKVGLGTQTGANDNDVMQQITRILNCHMHSLNWIHHNTQEIMDRLKVLNSV